MLLQSPMDRLHLMAECLDLHRSEYELKVLATVVLHASPSYRPHGTSPSQEGIVDALTFSMSSLELTTYVMAWKAKPFASDWKRNAASI